MNKNKIKNNTGFVLLYTMVLSSIILSVALGIVGIALKEAQFSTSARATNEAFFAADTGAECALYYDYNKIESPFDGSVSMNCANDQNVKIVQSENDPYKIWNFRLRNLGNSNQACADVKFSINTTTMERKIISRGYSNGDASNGIDCTPASNSVERELEVNY